MDRRSHIASKLERELEAVHVDVVDESHLHAGHPGAAGGGGHFRVVVVSPKFERISTLARQRLVYAVLADEMKRDIHALAMRTLTPSEWRGEV